VSLNGQLPLSVPLPQSDGGRGESGAKCADAARRFMGNCKSRACADADADVLLNVPYNEGTRLFLGQKQTEG